MNQLVAVAKNTYLQTVRQPAYGIIVLVTLGALALAPSVTGYTLDDDNKMLRDIGLSTLLVQGLFLACFAASSVLDTEIEDKTVLTSASKPINRAVFVAGKYLGLLGAVLAAHYLASIALFMCLRHGVLQMSSETSDATVLIFGPVMMAVVAVAATALNYLYEKRFLPTLFKLALAAFTLSAAVLVVIDRDGNLQSYEIIQTMDNLPPECSDPAVFNDIIFFRPLEGHAQIEGHRGHLVRKWWQGPINDKERAYLVGLSNAVQWKKDVEFLVLETHKNQGVQILKAVILMIGAHALAGAIALASATRLGILATFVITFVVMLAGLGADQILGPLAEKQHHWAEWLQRAIPNFQFFWVVDAIAEAQRIPWSYVTSAMGYGALYVGALLGLAMALFETREVG